MLSREEEVLLNHLGIDEGKAREMQSKARYVNLIDYLSGACLIKDQADFDKLIDRIGNKFSGISEFQASWDFIKQLERVVSKLEE
jgi:uncharacterized protein with von Willebrand factor type A (vWA) domain